MKILATSSALTLLGPDYRYRTEVWGVGEMRDGGETLAGDLVLRATGDPTLSRRFYPTAEAPLDTLAERLWEEGVRRIDGALVVDASPWDSTTVPGSWMVANLPGTSAATGGAFAIGEGVLTIEITGGAREGEPAAARWLPSTPPDFLGVHYLTVHPDSSTRGRSVEYLPESKRLLVSGRIHPGETDTIRIAQRDPVPLAANALVLALERRGIVVEGGHRVAWEVGEPLGPDRCIAGPTMPPGSVSQGSPEDLTTRPRLPHCYQARLLADLASPPMAEIVEAILEPSQNWMTEQLVHTLGAELGEEGSWREGFQVEEELFTGPMGVDTLDFSFRDGSGLSAYNLVTPRGLVRILDFMRSSPQGEVFRHALAEPGEEEGTLRSRIEGLEGRVYAKTGTITHVNSLSGYLVAADGRDLIFSVLTNGSGLPSGLVRQAIDAVIRTASRH
jgi:D-alanyl-D-alanine carboxypeptidase/D-alanyl-D-alanine-endopeptidase (penicillin-binding protein 4)